MRAFRPWFSESSFGVLRIKRRSRRRGKSVRSPKRSGSVNAFEIPEAERQCRKKKILHTFQACIRMMRVIPAIRVVPRYDRLVPI